MSPHADTIGAPSNGSTHKGIVDYDPTYNGPSAKAQISQGTSIGEDVFPVSSPPPPMTKERLEDAKARGIDPQVMRHPETGIRVLVCGAGLGGLACALECWRKGHTVQVLDRSPGPVWTGDNIQIQPSAVLMWRHWPEMGYEIEANQYDVAMSYYRHSGERIYGPAPPMFNDPQHLANRRGFSSVNAHARIKLYRAFLRQVARIGIEIEWGTKVAEYWEDTVQGVGGIVQEDGRKRAADIVVAADGVRTKSSTIVAGTPKELQRSGKALYRAAYPIEHALRDPLVQEMWKFKKDGEPIWQFWIGNGCHCSMALTHDVAFWGFMHTHEATAHESWVPDVDPAEVIAIMERDNTFHPAIEALIRATPPGSVVNWQLVFRDPHETWTSPGGRVVQLGDAAHAFLPTSGNGATQAIEDAVTLATCLQLGGGARNAADAARAYNRLRFQRVSCGQKMAFVNLQVKHHTDWDAIARDPAQIRSKYPRWVWSHDAEAYAYDKFNEAFQNVVTDGRVELHHTNVPRGYKHKPWTMAEVMDQIKAGKNLSEVQEGDWS